MPSRRTVLSGLAALPALSLSQMAAAQTAPRLLRTQEARHRIAPTGYDETRIWGFDGTLPGPELRFAQGARAQIDVENALPQTTSVHWHGIRIENAMDGVPGLTQDPIARDGRFAYDFALPDAGTFWYHSHAQSVEQVERGLYGAFIVEESDPVEVDGDHVLVLDDVRLDRDAQITTDFDNRHDRSHAGRLGNVTLTNGVPELALPLGANSRVRLRLVNAANARIFELGLQGLTAWIVALDGMPLATPEPAPERLTLAPAQRIDLVADVTAQPGEDAFLVEFTRDGAYAQTVFPVTPGTRTARDTAPGALPPNPDFPIDLADARPVPLTIAGGAMRGLASAIWEGERYDGRALAQEGQFWALNDHAGRPEAPLIDAALGESVRLGLVNDTAFPHAMHLHGMHFAAIATDGTLGPLRDTILMAPGTVQEIAFNAHNPGDWLFHCHMLGHHAAGMGTWLRVRA